MGDHVSIRAGIREAFPEAASNPTYMRKIGEALDGVLEGCGLGRYLGAVEMSAVPGMMDDPGMANEGQRALQFEGGYVVKTSISGGETKKVGMDPFAAYEVIEGSHFFDFSHITCISNDGSVVADSIYDGFSPQIAATIRAELGDRVYLG